MILLNDKTRGATLARKISDVLSAGYWMSTQSTAYCLLSMAKFSKGITSEKLVFSYKSGDGKTRQVSSYKPVVQINLPLPEKSISGHIVLHNSGKGVVFTRVIMEGIPEAGKEEDFSNQLNIDVSYHSVGGKVLDISEVTQGTDLYAVITVKNSGDFNCSQLALTEIFPPGWEISNARLADVNLPEKTDFNYQDIRDDRVYTYFDLRRGEQKTFTVLINAAYLGKYYLPGVYCEAMYDNSIGAMRKGKWVEVVTP
jgi:hypothetical protein